MAKETSTVVDMKNTITAQRLMRLLRMQLKALETTPSLAKTLPPMMVWGAPGVGKSSIIREIADEFKIGFIDVRLAQHEPVDVRGLPVPNQQNKSIEWWLSNEWPREGRGILLFDELTAADRSLQVAAYELILDRRLGSYSVPDGWYICAAGNRIEDNAVAMTMSSALSNRFMHVNLVEDVDSWSTWAMRHGIHPSVTGFLRYKPECLFRLDNHFQQGWPSPRAWERVSTMLGVLPSDDESLLRTVVYGLVGSGAGVEFMEFHKLNEQFEDVRKLMLNPKKKVEIPTKIDRRYALCTALAYHVWRGQTDEERAALLDGFFRISLSLSSDFACMTMLDAMNGCGVLDAETAAKNLFEHPQYGAWAKRHGLMMKKHLSF